jgi:hypothetical protein
MSKAFKALVVGVSQTGKSTFALHLALSTGKQILIWDANEVFLDIVKSPVSNVEDLRYALNKGEPVIVYDGTGFEDREAEFKKVSAVLEDYDGHTLLIDEAGDVQKVLSPNSGVDRLYRRSGRRDNDIIETTHKPQQVATLNRTLTTDTYVFGISRGADVRAIGQEFSEEAAEAAAQLPDYVYIHLHNRTGEFEVVDDAEAWYIPLDQLLPEREKLKVEPHRRRLFEEEY